MNQELFYVIIPWHSVQEIDFCEVENTSPETVRKNVLGTKCIVKYYGEMPQCLVNNQDKSPAYTVDQLKPIIATEEWLPVVEEYSP